MPTSFHVLVPLDGSAKGDRVLPYVERLCLPARLEGELRLHLLGVSAPGSGDGAALATHLGAVADRMARLGVESAAEVLEGPAAPTILARIRALRPDLVAMSTHGRGDLQRLLRGSVADDVLRRSEVPVFLVTPRIEGPQRVRRILVPLDGTERAAAVLPIVERVAAAEGASVVLLRTFPDAQRRPVLAFWFTPERMAATLTPWRLRLEQTGVMTEVRADAGDAAATIRRIAEEEDVGLIAMATHGREGLDRLVEGSVTAQVLHRSRRPLLVVHAP